MSTGIDLDAEPIPVLVKTPDQCVFCASRDCHYRIYTESGKPFDHVACPRHHHLLERYADSVLGVDTLPRVHESCALTNLRRWIEKEPVQLDLFAAIDDRTESDRKYEDELYKRINKATENSAKITDAQLQELGQAVTAEYKVARTKFAAYFLRNVLYSLYGEVRWRLWYREYIASGRVTIEQAAKQMERVRHAEQTQGTLQERGK